MHLRAPTRGREEKGCSGIIHYDSSFRNNNEAYRSATPSAPRILRLETRPRAETRKLSLSLSLSQIRIGARTKDLSISTDCNVTEGNRGNGCDDSRTSPGSSSAVVAMERRIRTNFTNLCLRVVIYSFFSRDERSADRPALGASVPD